MGFHAGFITVDNEQISLAVVSDPSVCSDQSDRAFWGGAGQVEADVLSMWEAAGCAPLSHCRDL